MLGSKTMALGSYDPQQVRLMEEECILVDRFDTKLGYASKKDCHLLSNILTGSYLHRAFSVFVFDQDSRLLLQQRSMSKITFPGYWTNTCCSHPLRGAEENGLEGTVAAAIRKLDHELGMKGFDKSRFEYLSKIHYMAPSDSQWGEHEVDTILFYQDVNSIPVNQVENEVMDHKFVTKSQLKEWLGDSTKSFTPWFKLICDRFLFEWWGAQRPARASGVVHDLVDPEWWAGVVRDGHQKK